MKQFFLLLLVLSVNFYGQTNKIYPIEVLNARKKVVQDSLILTEKNYNEAIKFNDKNADYYYKRAKCRMEMQKVGLENTTVVSFGTYKDLYDKAEKDFKKAIKLNPVKYSDTAYYLMAITKIKTFLSYNDQDFHKGVDYLTKTIKFNPNYADAYYLRGKTRYYLNQLTGCLEDLNKAIELNTSNLADAYFFRGTCKLGFTGFRITNFKSNKDEACADFEKAASMGSINAKTTLQQTCK